MHNEYVNIKSNNLYIELEDRYDSVNSCYSYYCRCIATLLAKLSYLRSINYDGTMIIAKMYACRSWATMECINYVVHPSTLISVKSEYVNQMWIVAVRVRFAMKH